MDTMRQQDTQSDEVPDWPLGWRLARALDLRGIGVGEIADEIGVSRKTVSRWLHDKGTPPREFYLNHFVKRCRVNDGWLKTGRASDDERDPSSNFDCRRYPYPFSQISPIGRLVPRDTAQPRYGRRAA